MECALFQFLGSIGECSGCFVDPKWFWDRKTDGPWIDGQPIEYHEQGRSALAQQWGNDHAPELDALSAQEIVVIKGVGSLSVPGASNGASISLQATAIPFSERWNGRTAYAFGTNGRSHSLHALLFKKHRFLGLAMERLFLSGGRWTGSRSPPDQHRFPSWLFFPGDTASFPRWIEFGVLSESLSG